MCVDSIHQIEVCMKLLQTGTQRIDEEAIICRQSPYRQVVGGGVLTMMVTSFPLFWWWLEAPALVVVVCGIIALVVASICVSEAVAALKKTNWLLAIQTDGVWVNLRSFRNRKLASATTVVHFSWDDLKSAAATDGLSPLSSDSTSVDKISFLELQLAEHVQTDDLQTAIADEIQRRTVPTTFAAVKSTRQDRQISLRLIDERYLQFTWQSQIDSIVPDLQYVLQELGKRIQIEDHRPASGSVVTHADSFESSLSSTQMDDLHVEILEKVEVGQLLDAIRLYRIRTGCHLKDARTAVHELLKRQSDD